jgi:hypothetical protein
MLMGLFRGALGAAAPETKDGKPRCDCSEARSTKNNKGEITTGLWKERGAEEVFLYNSNMYQTETGTVIQRGPGGPNSEIPEAVFKSGRKDKQILLDT